LINLTGLENLTSIGGGLLIYWNDSLASLTELKSLSSIGSDLWIQDNHSLSTCDAEWLCEYLSNPSGRVIIIGNEIGCLSVVDVGMACGALPYLPYGNYSFLSQADIDNFQTIFPDCTELEGNVSIIGNDIANLNGLNGVASIGGSLGIAMTNSLTSLTGLENLVSVGSGLWINENADLASLDGLGKLTSITASYLLWENDILTSLIGLDNQASIGGSLVIGKIFPPFGGGNPALINLTGLESLISLGADLLIRDNPNLKDITGLDNIIAGSILNLFVYENDSLSNCDIKGICDYLASPNGTIEIHHNKTGCNSREEIHQACTFGLDENSATESHINNFTNPTSKTITILMPTMPDKNTFMTIYNINGQGLLLRQIKEKQTVVDVSGLTTGIYIVRVVDDNGVKAGKFVKN